MKYDIFVVESCNGLIFSENILYNSEQFEMTKTISAVISFIKKYYSGCIHKQIRTLTDVKTELKNNNFFTFEDFDEHKITFILRIWNNSYLVNRDIVLNVKTY